MTPKNNKGVLIYAVLAFIIIISLTWAWPYIFSDSKDVKYSEIISYFDNYEVTNYTFDLGSGELVFQLKDKDEKIKYTVPNVSIFLNDTENYRQEYNKKNPDSPLEQDYFKIKDNSWLLTIVPTLVLLVMAVLLFFFMMRQAGGGSKYSTFGKANVKNQMHQGRKTTFADVAGADEEKHELEEIVDFLKNPKKYSDIGARIPKGVLLLGPPGTGKTLLARAVSGEAGCPFFSISGSDFVEMFVGVGASRVRDLFEQAKKHAPSIIFIDEIDAVGRHRGAGLGGGHDEREQTLNQLLVEMDGFTGNENIIVIAATNRRDILDPALLRPGRFDRQIVVGYPDVKGREEILLVHTKNKPLAPDVNLKVIAQTTVGFTGADLENLVNEASLLAARKNKKAITREEIEEATIKVIAGPEKKSRVVTEKEKKLTAYHESGHALCTYYCETQDKVHQVSIIPRGMAGGYTMSLPEHDKSFVSKKEMEENIITLLGGRVAEQLILDDISTGASNDIERATAIARNMVTRYGFSEKLGPIVYGTDSTEVFLGRDINSSRNYSENVAAEIDTEVRKIIENAYEKAKKILEEHVDQLHFLSKYLLKFEKIDADEFEKIMSGEIGEEVFSEPYSSSIVKSKPKSDNTNIDVE
ncbi:MAG: ATP-dependent metallopeptidase FtsH/Yme1/Tma family protein [Clostridiales bacterium]|nr:ATP-dependent metallopeptidase FtsH/Yme1/Tma family protein [Clostridiales bacterium]